MINELILNYIIIYVFLEIYEVQWQKATTMVGMLARMHEYYKKSVFLFLIMHPTFYFSIFIMLVSNYNMYAIFFFSIKVLDIAMKIMLIKQVFIDKEISHELSLALLTPLNKYLPYMGLVVYPPFIYLAFS
ncbi:MAG: hypothetical protein ACI9TV_003151 [Sulfurimonas sp.]|jgi:hypothetical protein|uniref:hypothetical protein n=1 Tax=Sulfurimonas sp. TaxID=2022749 RepID=UPI0039E3DF65